MHAQYIVIQHKHTYSNQSVNQLVNQLVNQFVICSVGQCLLSGGAVTENLLPWPGLDLGAFRNHWTLNLMPCALDHQHPQLSKEPTGNQYTYSFLRHLHLPEVVSYF